MNERDYMILEALSILFGVIATFTLAVIFLFTDLLIKTFLLLDFTAMFGYALGIVFHYKRRMYIMQMEKDLEEHRDDFK